MPSDSPNNFKYTPGQIWEDYPHLSYCKDLNNDRNLDVIIYRDIHDMSEVIEQSYATELWYGDGQGNFHLADVLTGNTGTETPVLPEDLNGDGQLEIVASGGNITQIWFTDGQGNYTSFDTLPGYFQTVEDVDKNGTLDIVTCPSDSNFSVWVNDGQGDFTLDESLVWTDDYRYEPPSLEPPFYSYSFHDFNKDHIPDRTMSWSDPNGEEEGFTIISLNNGAGEYIDSATLPGIFADALDFDIDALDFNGDGNLDLVTSSTGNYDFFTRLWFGDGQGNFRLADTLQGYTSWINDLNADGSPDIIAGDVIDSEGQKDSLHITILWLNDGQGNFTLIDTLQGYAYSGEDFNGDQISDLFMRTGGGENGRLQLWLSQLPTPDTGSEPEPTPLPEQTLDSDTLDSGIEYNDVVLGDVIFGSAKNDRLIGQDGNDFIDGRAGNDRIDGGVGDDTLLGGKGNDRILGGDGNDILFGGLGKDILIGGAGKDIFVFNNGKAFRVDKVIGFDVVEDAIDLSRIFVKAEFASVEESDRFQTFVQLMQVGKHTEIRIDTDGTGDGTRLTTLARLQNVTASTLNATHFVVA